MKSLKIKTKLIASFTLTMILIATLGFVALSSLSLVNFKAGEIANSWMKGILLLSNAQHNIALMRRAEFNYILQTDPAAKADSDKSRTEAIDAARKYMQEYFNMIDTATYENPDDKIGEMKTLSELDEKWKAYLAVGDEMIALARGGNAAQALAILQVDSREKFSVLNAFLEDMVEYNAEGGRNESIATQEIYERNRMQTIGLILLSLVITIIATVMLVRNLERAINELTRVSEAVGNGDLKVKANVYADDELGKLSGLYNVMIANIRELILSIQENAKQVSDSAEQLTDGANQSAHVIQTVAENVSNISASADAQVVQAGTTSDIVNTMASHIEQASTAAVQASTNAQTCIDKAKTGVVSIDRAIEQMSMIQTTVLQSATVVETLGERSKEIGAIVETIAAISSQTNLLALNAAIEAARAGEQGRGFAVVAEEVRKLAEQSQEATEKIADLIGSIQKETEKAVATMQEGTQVVETGSQVVHESGSAFKELSEITIESAQQIKDISATMEQLAGHTEQIVSAMAKMNDSSKEIGVETQTAAAATEEQSASMEEIASASQTLEHLAQDMQSATLKFNV